MALLPFIGILCLLLATGNTLEEKKSPEKYEILSNAVEGKGFLLPECHHYELPKHLIGSDRVVKLRGGSTIIKNLQPIDVGIYACRDDKGPKKYELRVHKEKDLIQLNCSNDYLSETDEIVLTSCEFKSTFKISNISVWDWDSGVELNSNYSIAEKEKIEISFKPHIIAKTNYFGIKITSLPSLHTERQIIAVRSFLAPIGGLAELYVVTIGESLNISCRTAGGPKPDMVVTYQECDLEKEYPKCEEKPESQIEISAKLTEKEYSATTIVTAETEIKFDLHNSSGTVACRANNGLEEKWTMRSICLVDPDVHLKFISDRQLIRKGQPTKLTCIVPYCLYKNDATIQLQSVNTTYNVEVKFTRQKTKYYYNVTYDIRTMGVDDEGTYTCAVESADKPCTTQNKPQVMLKMLRNEKPNVTIAFDPKSQIVLCQYPEYPKHNLSVLFTECSDETELASCNESYALLANNHTIDLEINRVVKIPPVGISGRYSCIVTNENGTTQQDLFVCVGDPKNDTKLAIKPPLSVTENQASITCKAAICEFRSVRLVFRPGNRSEPVSVPEPSTDEKNEYYRTVTTHIGNIANYPGGNFACEGFKIASNVTSTSDIIIVGIPASIHSSGLASGIPIILTLIILGAVGNITYQRQRHKTRNIRLAKELKKGDVKKINPDLPLHEQAEFLPLHSKWEFPRNSLKLGKQLGAGFFGVVLQGEATGIVPYEDKTTVAVKMAKKHSEGTLLRALIAELKIMSHMGRHPNVVRLLGAVIDGLGDNELMVIVEFCVFGNLNTYLLKNRSRFVDNWTDTHPVYGNVPFDQNTVVRYLVMSPPTAQPANSLGFSGERIELINHEGMPLNTKILIGWSYQIARAMEWLASKRLMHGDLAARNVLLTTNNIVKICDFGLAKNMYTNSYYKCKEDAKLPVKWLALESVKDHVFTLKSDVWAYGVLMWEIFSLGMVPYPEFDSYKAIFENLQRGYRMGRPGLAPECIFQLMLRCWKQDPEERPLFSELSCSLYQMLDEAEGRFLRDQEANGLQDEELASGYLDMFRDPGHMINEYIERNVSYPGPRGYMNVSSQEI